MKQFIALLITMSTLFPTYAQPQSWVWARGAMGYGFSECVTTDISNNIYSAGYFAGTISFGNINFVSGVGNDIFLLKYGSDGTEKWAISGTGEHATAITTDKKGNLFMLGYFRDSMTIGSISMINNGYRTVFLAKFDSIGIVQWAKALYRSDWGYGWGIGTDTNDNVYMSADYDNTVILDNDTLLGKGVLIAKFDANGNGQWLRGSRTTTLRHRLLSLTVDPGGNAYMTGTFLHWTAFGNDTLYGYTNMSGDDGFIAAYSTNGDYKWSRGFKGPYYDRGSGINHDKQGNILVVGTYDYTVTLEQTILNGSDREIFLAKYDSNGKLIWAKNCGHRGVELAGSVGVDSTGNAYIAGIYESSITFPQIGTLYDTTGIYDSFVAGYDTVGNIMWAKVAQCSVESGTWGIAADRSGNVFIAGWKAGAMYMDTVTLQDNGYNFSPFVAKIGIPDTIAINAISQLIPRNKSIVLFPNPALNEVQIIPASIPKGNFTIKICSVTGAEMLTTTWPKGTAKFTINTSELPPALYICYLYDNCMLVGTAKLVKQ